MQNKIRHAISEDLQLNFTAPNAKPPLINRLAEVAIHCPGGRRTYSVHVNHFKPTICLRWYWMTHDVRTISKVPRVNGTLCTSLKIYVVLRVLLFCVLLGFPTLTPSVGFIGSIQDAVPLGLFWSPLPNGSHLPQPAVLSKSATPHQYGTGTAASSSRSAPLEPPTRWVPVGVLLVNAIGIWKKT